MADQTKGATGNGSADPNAKVPEIVKPLWNPIQLLSTRFDIARGMHGITEKEYYMVEMVAARQAIKDVKISAYEYEEWYILSKELVHGTSPWDMGKAEELVPILTPQIKSSLEVYEGHRNVEVTPEALLCLAQALRNGALADTASPSLLLFLTSWCKLYQENPNIPPGDVADLVKKAASLMVNKKPFEIVQRGEIKVPIPPVYSILEGLFKRKANQLRIFEKWQRDVERDYAAAGLSESSAAGPHIKNLMAVFDFTIDMLESEKALIKDFKHLLAVDVVGEHDRVKKAEDEAKKAEGQ